MQKSSKNSGFILILLLLVISIASIAMITAAQASCQRALIASKKQSDLQAKWAGLSAKETLLNSAEVFLLAASTQESQPLKVTQQVELGGIDFVLIIYDEQAKANVNFLARDKKNSRKFHERIIRLQNNLPIALKPIIKNKSSFIQRYHGYEDMFGIQPLDKLVNFKPTGTLTDRITFWGNGQLNFKRAPEGVLRTGLEDILTDFQIQNLIELRNQLPDCTISELFDNLDLSELKTKKLSAKITDRSTCFSLWVITNDPAGKKYRLYVKDLGSYGNFSQSSGDYSFLW